MSLSKQTIEKIELFTYELLQEAYTSQQITPPINLSLILSYSGLSLFEGDFHDPQIDGAFSRRKNAIYLKKNASHFRKVFTTAHELGHYYLHQGKDKEIFYRKDSSFINEMTQEEQEANWFAASLLMPKPVFTRFWQFLNNVDLVAEKFSVSTQAAHYRAKNIGLLS